MNIFKQIANTIQGIQSKMIDGELEDGTKVVIESFGEDLGVNDLVSVVTDEGAIPAPDGEHLLSDGKTVIVTEGGKITEIKEKEVEAMKDDKPSDVEAALLMLAEGLQAIKTELAEMKAAQTAPTPQAKRTPAPTAQLKPKSDPALDKVTAKVDVMAERFKAHMRTKGVSIN